MLTLAAHKFYGPKGVGVLHSRRGTPLTPRSAAAAKERRRRAGTENVAGIVLVKALRLAEARREEFVAHCTALRDQLIGGISSACRTPRRNGHASRRLPNNVNIAFEYVEGESVLLLLDQQGIAASSGSACTSGSLEASHVLSALGLPYERAIWLGAL